MTTYIGHTSESSKADLAVNRARASQQSVIVEDYGFAASASGATNRQAILDAVGAACGYQDAAAMNAAKPAASARRDALKKIILPAGDYDLDTLPEIKATWMLTVEGAGKDVTNLHVTGGDATTPIEAGLKLNGVGWSVFRDFSIVIDGDATYGLYGLWDNTTSASSFSAVKFYNVGVSGKFRTAGFKIGKPESSLQEDQTAWYSCRAIGTANDNDTYWQAGFHLGTGTTGNNLIHMLYDVSAAHLKHGVTSDRAGVMIYGGIIQSNEVDVYVTGPADYLEVSGIRSEHSTRFIDTAGLGNTTPTQAIVRSCQFDCTALAADGRFIRWNFAGALAVDALRATGNAPSTSPRIYCATPTKPVTVHTSGLAIEGTAVADVVENTGTNAALVTAVHVGYDKLTSGISTEHAAFRLYPTPEIADAATDAATAQTLVNDLRTKLIDAGLIAAGA